MTRRRRQGFTLIEVLLVLVILVILGSLVGIQIRSAQKSALLKAAKSQVGMFDSPLQRYALDMGDFPTASVGLGALVSAPSDAKSAQWAGPYLEKGVPADPWGNQYQYANPGRHNAGSYDVWSLGSDGADGTDDDIGNW
ncbi:MAG TPA: type II secretion system major pseudopilin GspG [Pirellulales bacterium]|nr:type II secretion system major pseudopilin GspG [Pirellulales bacterium]